MKLAQLPNMLRSEILFQLKLGHFKDAKQMYDTWYQTAPHHHSRLEPRKQTEVH